MTLVLTRASAIVGSPVRGPIAHAVADLRRDLATVLAPVPPPAVAPAPAVPASGVPTGGVPTGGAPTGDVPAVAPAGNAPAVASAPAAEPTGEAAPADIRVHLDPAAGLPSEAYRVTTEGGDVVVTASDELGAVYGIYRVSHELLGVEPLWFWNDQVIVPRAEIRVPDDLALTPASAAVRYRGWFLNDEVLLREWTYRRDRLAPWDLAFEALLRLGGNTVIPGTDQDTGELQRLALSRGLYIAQHHAEPLGARMFARVHPDLQPSYARYPELFEELWQEAIDSHRGDKVIWNLGFRGQGDVPFWHDDPAFADSASRGGLVSRIIRRQYDMVRAADPHAPVCVYLYGETMELWREGVIEVPGDAILIWSDNGFGRMVSRRQGNHDPRVPALPGPDEAGHAHGIYYHVSFYDLQAASHILAMPAPAERMAEELETVLAQGAGDLWLINVSNVRPHAYLLDLVAQIWREGRADAAVHRRDYARRYVLGETGPAAGGPSVGFGGDRAAPRTPSAEAVATSGVEGHRARPGTESAETAAAAGGHRAPSHTEAAEAVAGVIAGYAKAAPSFGPEWDQFAGDQLPNYVTRDLVTRFVVTAGSDEPAPQLRWFSPASTLRGQAERLREISGEGERTYAALADQAEVVATGLSGEARVRFEETWGMAISVMHECHKGAALAAEAVLTGLDGDDRRAFLLAGRGRNAFTAADSALRGSERGRWTGFYANDALTDISFSAHVLETLMAFLRARSDGPGYYRWQREYMYREQDRRVALISHYEKRLDDEQLLRLMEAADDPRPAR